jgi:hypothetical protein
MANATLIGIDVGTHRLFVHAQDEHGNVLWRKKASRHQLYALLATGLGYLIAKNTCAREQSALVGAQVWSKTLNISFPPIRTKILAPGKTKQNLFSRQMLAWFVSPAIHRSLNRNSG